MADLSRPIAKSPAELVAVAIAAHKTGDTELKTAALRKLREQFGVKLTFGMPHVESEVSDG